MNVEKTRVTRIPRQPFPVQTMIHQQQVQNVEHFNCLGSTITNDAGCTREIKSRIANAKAALNNKKTLIANKLDSNLRKKLVKSYIWSRALQGAETWAFWETDKKYLENFEMWWRRGMEKIITQSHGGEEYPAYNKHTEGCGNWIGHIFCWNCLLKYVTEGKKHAYK